MIETSPRSPRPVARVKWGIMENPDGARAFGLFVQLLSMSGLIEPHELERRLYTFGNDRPPQADGPLAPLKDLTDHLIDAGLLTFWQRDKLLDGKWKGFFLDGYKLIGHLETDDAYSYYLAEEVATGRRFSLRVTPQARAKDPKKIEYKIVREVIQGQSP